MEALKATDLRIGNKILVDGDMEWEIRTIESIGKDTCGYQGYFITHETGSTSIEDIFDDGDYLIKGIPLTPDLLMKCGFETKTPNNDNWSFNLWNKAQDCSIDIEPDGNGGFLFYYRLYERNRVLSIFYLHQLQNLYYALSGQELTVKL